MSDNKFVKIYNFFAVNNYLIVNDIEKADIVILDLCWVWISFLNDTISKIDYCLSKNQKIILMWCITDTLKDKYWDNIIYIDTKNYSIFEVYFDFIVPLNRVDSYFSASKINLLDTWNHVWNTWYSLEDNFNKKFFIEISIWCQLNCSYCNIKKVKGNTKSLKKEDIINEIEKAVKDWKTDIFLLSDDCWSYWSDIWTNLVELLNAIFEISDEIMVYITNIYPSYLVKYYEEIKKYIYADKIPYILVPVQHYSPRILKMMNRAYDVEKIIGVLKDIKESSKTELHNHIIFNYHEETLEEFVETFKYLNYYSKTFYFKHSDVNNIYWKNHISYDLDKKIILLKKLQKKYSIDIPLW